MRADGPSRTAPSGRIAGLLVLTLALAGCKTEKDPDSPTLLGAPPGTAYLGVEYYYNWGAYGGEDILDYSLSNAPSWLALEDTRNKARQGVIMRGVPGLTGGNRGEADLGKTEGIYLVGTDGKMAGGEPFDIEVRYNALALAADDFTEGETPAMPEPTLEHCAIPDLSVPGRHRFTVPEYDDSGAVTGEREVTFDTRQVLAVLTLDQPSVTRVEVAFELSSDYDASVCESGAQVTPPHQRCDHSTANASDAMVGRDIVGLGTDSPAPVDQDGHPLDYLSYQADDQGFLTRGIVTLEPGVQECYIRLEVVDDRFAESAEFANLELTEVRSGMAGLGETNDGVRVNLVLRDNEPVVTLSTLRGSQRDTLNVGDVREYRAVLSGDRDHEVRARLIHSDDSSARLNSQFVIERWMNDTWEQNPELVFPVGQDEVNFRIRVDEAGYSNPDLTDRVILLALDDAYQAGREYYVRAETDNLLRVSLNELTEPLAPAQGGSFVATDLAVGHGGRLFVAGYDPGAGNQVRVRIFDQKGNLLQDAAVTPAGTTLAPSSPVIRTGQRKVTEGNVKVDRYEFVVAFSSADEIPGTQARGGLDALVSVFWYDSASNGGEYVPYWLGRTGTPGDDRVRGADIQGSSGYIVLGGETDGTWPGQAASGGIDSFLQRIDSVADGASVTPQVAWTRQLGSAGDDRVVAATVAGSSALLAGSARGAVGGADVIGGEDAFFYSASDGTSELTVRQVGSEADEPLSDALYDSAAVWLLGNAPGAYSTVTDDEDTLTLAYAPLASAAGFILGYSLTGTLEAAFTVNDEDDVSTETFSSLIAFDGDLVAAGHSEGDFSGTGTALSGQPQAILARISRAGAGDEDATVLHNPWRYQLPEDGTTVRALGNYRDDEIVALLTGDGEPRLILLSPEGVLLTPLP